MDGIFPGMYDQLQYGGPTDVDVNPDPYDQLQHLEGSPTFVGPSQPVTEMPKEGGMLAAAMRQPGVADEAAAAEAAPDDGIGLMGMLGIGNMIAGIGSQIFKAATAKPKRPRHGGRSSGGGNPFR